MNLLSLNTSIALSISILRNLLVFSLYLKRHQGREFNDTAIMDANDIYDESFERDLSKEKILDNCTRDYIDAAFKVLRNSLVKKQWRQG